MARPRKRVTQIEKVTGEVLAYYDSVASAAAATGIHHSNISACCSGYVQSAGGYKWKHTDAPDVKKVVKMSEEEAIACLKKYHNSLSYNALAEKTGWSYKRLRRLYDKHKIYKNGV